MKRKITLTAVLLTCCFSTFGQDSNSSAILESVSRFVPSERVFVHTDRDYYRRGDTIWYRAFLQSEGTAGVSNFVYVDLIDDEQNVVSRHKVRRKNDQFYSQIPVELSFRPGGYTLRAYTYWMLSFDSKTLFHKPIFITADHLTAVLKEAKPVTESKSIKTRMTESGFSVSVDHPSAQFLAVYNATALYVLHPVADIVGSYSISTTKLPVGEIVVAILDNRGRVIERKGEFIEPVKHSPVVDVTTTNLGDKSKVTLTVRAPRGSYSLALAHADLCAATADITSLLYDESTAAIEGALMGRPQNFDHYVELEQALVGYVRNISDRKLAKGFEMCVSLGRTNDWRFGYVDSQTGRFQIDLSGVTGNQTLMCKLMEPRGTSVLDCVIESESTLFPKGNSPYRFVNKPKVETKVAYSKSPEPETEHVINVAAIEVKARTGRRPYEPFTMAKGMAQFNLVNNREIYLPQQMDSRTLYEILTVNRLLPKYRERFNPEYNRMGRSGASGGSPFRSIQTDDQFGWIKGKTETGGADGEGSTSMIRANAPVASGPERMPDDWLWTYVLDGMECSPDEGMFNHLMGEDISTIQLILRPYFMTWNSTLVVAIETKPTKDGLPRRVSRNFAKFDYVGYSPPLDFKYQSRNTIGWKPDLRVGRKPVTVEFLVPTDAVSGNYAVTLNGVTASGEPITSQIELAL